MGDLTSLTAVPIQVITLTGYAVLRIALQDAHTASSQARSARERR
jgi:hypothetical protein